MPGLTWEHIVSALTFTTFATIWVFEHFWSLRTEEQFYVVWPAILVFALAYRKGSRSRTAAAWVAIAVIVIEPVVRMSCFAIPSLRRNFFLTFQVDALMFGVLGALLQGRARFERVYRRVTHLPWLLPILLFGVMGLLWVRFQNYWNLTIGYTLEGFVTLIWMLWLIRNPNSLQGRLFNHPAVAWLGRLSYSLYLWQTLFLNPARVTVFGRYGWWNKFPTPWICILALAVFSFYCIEQPALRLRDRIMRKWKPAESLRPAPEGAA